MLSAEAGWQYTIGLMSHSGLYWYNEQGMKKKSDVSLTTRELLFSLKIPVYHNLGIIYNFSYIMLKGVSNFWTIYNNTLIPVRTLLQKNHGIGDSAIVFFSDHHNKSYFITIFIPTGDSDFYPGVYPTGSGRWKIGIGEQYKLKLLIPLKLKLSIRYLFSHTYSYISYNWNTMYYNSPSKWKFFMNLETDIKFTNNFSLQPGILYYHKIALSKENMLWGKFEFRLFTKTTTTILSILIPIYGKYYPAQSYPIFFWDSQLPVNYTVALKWVRKW